MLKLPPKPQLVVRQDDRVPGFPIHYAITPRTNPTSMVVLMPSALPRNRSNPERPHFTRWSWANYWPDSLVIAVSDPALAANRQLEAAWYLHPEYDFIAILADFVRDMATEANIPPNRITFYGSSLGGFGAIGVAAHLAGSKAIAEIPSIHIPSRITSHVARVGKLILGQSIFEFEKIHPERVGLIPRCEYAGHIPDLQLYTNPRDFYFSLQWDFFNWADASEFNQNAQIDLITTTRTSGHRQLEKEFIAPRIIP